MSENKELANKTQEALATADQNVIYGFEETKSEDIIIPRIKVINALSPERQDGDANEGDIINALTKEDVRDKVFVPIKQYYSNIEWNPDRGAEQRIFCRSLDGRIGVCDEGSKVCAQCKRNQFDNTKQGKDAQPACTAYLNFLGFFVGDPMPVVLSFAKTNYNDGKKMLSIAKSLRSSIWNYGYKLSSKKITKDRNAWFNIVPSLAGETDMETRQLAMELYKAYENTVVNADYEETTVNTAGASVDAETESEIA